MWFGELKALLLLGFLSRNVNGLRYDEKYVDYNLNQNKDATDPIFYDGTWEGHNYTPSPENWRFPFYTIMLDRFVNGNPDNDNANGTILEQDITGTQLRWGGDIAGLVDTLDYLQGMGIKGIYFGGSMLINAPWNYDSYSPLDQTLLDMHFGNITEWRAAIQEIHDRGMYIVFDNTMATLGDLIGFKDYLNSSAPFEPHEMEIVYKTDRQYLDWTFPTEYNETCEHFPRLYLEEGKEVPQEIYDMFGGCYNGDFDQFGDTEAFGVYPDYRRQLTKFASVQDRLREWVPAVNQKLAHFSCIMIKMLDIDGFRFDKALQVTVDAQGEFSKRMRECARAVGKDNFFLPGEITGGNTMGSIYIGRGRVPEQWFKDINTAYNTTQDKAKDMDIFIRDEGHQALDSAAFHYSFYRFLVIFLGMDGTGVAGYDVPSNFVEAWNEVLRSNDMINANTGKVDPRHMFGAMNQDTFRWPAIEVGHERSLMGLFITTLHLPGIPMLTWGEEQAFYVLDNTAQNYMFGRQPLASAPAWQQHGCYSMPATLYYQMPLSKAREGCRDDTVSYDHRDPSHPIRNILKHMYHLRKEYPVLQDGMWLEQLSNNTEDLHYPGNSGMATTTGLFSVLRYQLGVQDLGENLVPIWFLYHNRNVTHTYQVDCSKKEEAIISPFESGTTVKNLFFPHQETTLDSSPVALPYANNKGFNGCFKNITLTPFEFRAYVPKADFKNPPVAVTKFAPGHDARLQSDEPVNTVPIELHFSVKMDCDLFKDAVSFQSHTDDNSVPSIDESSIQCADISEAVSQWTAALPSVFSWKANLVNVKHGVHQVIVKNATVSGGQTTTNVTDRFLFRIGSLDNGIVFPHAANYSTTLLTKDADGTLRLKHTSAGASKFRYSTNFESSWSDWAPYETETKVVKQPWNGTKEQEWEGEHVVVQYYSKLLGSSAYMVHADLGYDTPRRIPHMYAVGKFNQFGYDSGLTMSLKHESASQWAWHYMDEWPNYFKFSIWGMNPDKQPDQSFIYGDVDGDHVVERLPPSSLFQNAVNITEPPPKPYLAFRVVLNDATLQYQLIPKGNMWVQFMLWLLLLIVPVLSGLAAVQAFKRSFYKVKFNEHGVHETSKLGMMVQKTRNAFMGAAGAVPLKMRSSTDLVSAAAAATAGNKRRKVLIATMEYNIDDWNIKIKIGGLGVMAQLMGKALKHQDLIWVVPCVGDVEYPLDSPAPSMYVTIMDSEYEIKVQYHIVDNITYVLLDAPVFRKQTKSEPYPPRMDDLESAIYYSAWNQCIAETCNRFPVDLYHINDYHGAIAPLYLLPRTIPVALSLHNAEFQGLWPMRTPEESKEVCKAYNLSIEVVKKYVQYGSAVFNLLHAGASYLRVHQNGFGAVGVSRKYGDRSFARYPIFWGLSKVGQLPNPDPTDTAEWDKTDFMNQPKIEVDPAYEAGRGDLRRQAQEWAGLNVDPEAELFVFVGRWSLQKGVDLIADIFPWVLDTYPKAQLITIGPMIDLYGRFAALKLAKLMELYPGRVFSKPEFTALPPYIFSGAEFALIPSRDEPFGLVAVEFGRKGALGVGARVGGLGQMPGWWYTVESTKAAHLTKQFKHAIKDALETDTKTRAMMRAWSAKQRFPVAEWLEKLEKLQGGVIKAHAKYGKKGVKKGNVLVKHSRASSIAAPLRNDVELVDRSPAWMRQVSDYDDDATTLHGGRNTSGMQTPRYPSTPGSPAMSPTPMYADSPYSSRAASPGPYNRDPQHGRNVSGNSAHDFGLGRNFSLPGPAGQQHYQPAHSRDASGFSMADTLPLPPPGGGLGMQQDNSSRASMLSVEDVVGDRHDYKLQQVDPFFTDSNGEFYHHFEEKLKSLNAGNSMSDLCIEDYLIKSEKEWFDMYLDARLGRAASPSSPRSPRASSRSRPSSPINASKMSLGVFKNRSSSKLSLPLERERGRSRVPSGLMNSHAASDNNNNNNGYNDHSPPDSPGSYNAQFDLPEDYVPPTGVKKYLQYRLGDWPVYSMLLALNQIIATNSYQVTLLTGEVGQTASKLYIIATVYLCSSVVWYTLSRTMPLLYPLSVPYFLYGFAFMLLGFSGFPTKSNDQVWLQNAATGLYAFASSSGSLAFAFNFGTDGGSTVPKWIQRLAIIQGLTQLYTLALWAWGSLVSEAEANSVAKPTLAGSPYLLAVCAPAALLLWAVGAVLYLGLPDFYREMPGPIPQLWLTLLKRRTIAWYLMAVCIQNYFLSSLFGRNWFFLFSSQHVPVWSMVILALFFFIFVWAIVLWGLAKASESHPWLFPMFAVGLGAPRWAQIWWGTSRIGVYMPWAGGVVAGAVLSRILWLWLGVLDGLQGAGIGMILMLTLTRVHVAAACVGAQVLGSIFTMLGRATAPNNVGPSTVFPDISQGVDVALAHGWFWVVLLLNLFICFGYFKFFRKEQVSKP
ncbi:alpha-1,3-glucan synthase [Colletotrichum navitas]|uniref:alpha-1,3-glucan synthase n=1 Tax=Colletotrichum navitas TaxID=681940 RepID=A0AAD8V1E2_9PEZI|nr:alpha-1,3-glucan synthase [Colletotrichum navitas]KAK1579891.1 alpha-1,3-glucan synthase [Colletotrichum navitas]